MEKWVLLFGVLALIFIHGVSAEVLLSQPGGLYNFGDELEVEVILRPNLEVNDFLIVEMVCGGDRFEIYKNYFSLSSGEQETINLNFVLNGDFGFENEDSCFMKAIYGDEFVESQDFEITNKILVGADLAKRIYEPGETVSIIGSALKINGDGVEGFLELKIDSLGILVGSVVSDGIFNVSFEVPSNYSGDHDITLKAYNKDNNNEIVNEGIAIRTVEIRSTLTKIEIIMESNNLIPGEEISYIVRLVDQADKEMVGDIAIEISKPDGSGFIDEVIESGEQNLFKTESNFSAGYWRIEAISGDIDNIKLIYVEEKKNLLFSLINNTLIVSNIGNIEFFGPIKVLIGSNVEVKQIKLEIGETRRFRLSAPEGTYQIGINDGDEEFSFGTVSLTGKAINVGEMEQGLIEFVGNNAFALLFLVLIVGGGVLLLLFKKKGFSGLPKLSKLRKEVNRNTNVGSSSNISSGQKHDAGVVLLKINSKLNKQGSEVVKKAIEFAKSNKAGVNSDEDGRIMLFTPLLTKNKDNGLLALKVAKEIEDFIKEHNKKHPNHIDYSLGVNVGEIIAESREGKLKFISVGNIVSLTKKISKEAKNEILVSDVLHRKLINKVRFKKSSNSDFWKIEKFSNRGKHEKFLKDFVKKQEEN